MSNAIQQIADKMLYLWEDAVSNPVKLVRIMIKPEDESMLEAFYEYLLALDTPQEGMVFTIDLPFVSEESFSLEVIDFIYKQVCDWNTSKKPADIIFEKVEWQPDYSLSDNKNPAALAVYNLNRIVSEMAYDDAVKFSFIFNLSGTRNFKECQRWFINALSIQFNKQMVWGISDYIGYEKFGKLVRIADDAAISIYPPVDMDAAAEKLAEQALNEDKSDPAASAYRLAMIRLMNSVKKKNEKQTDKYAKECIEIALENVKKDINWLGQFVTIYTILYTDKLARKELDNALYFCNKSVEAAELGIGRLDPSLANRLLGSSLVGQGGVLMRQKKWDEAIDSFERANEAYSLCKDYFMQAESLRLCGWCLEKQRDNKAATDCYIKGFRLIENLAVDVVKNSSYPLLLLKLLNNEHRLAEISDEELNDVLTRVIGEDWEDYLYNYKRTIGKYDGMAQ